jgi:hypothetical protein
MAPAASVGCTATPASAVLAVSAPGLADFTAVPALEDSMALLDLVDFTTATAWEVLALLVSVVSALPALADFTTTTDSEVASAASTVATMALGVDSTATMVGFTNRAF